MNLTFLKYFAMVAEVKNFTKAASLLHISQPTVTQAIKKIESELGVFLFDRSNKQVVLTQEGERFLASITKVLNDYEEAVQSVKDYALLQRGSIRFAVPPITSAYILPEVYNLFTQAYPKLQMVVSEDHTSDLVKTKIITGQADTGVIVATTDAAHLSCVVVRKVRLVVCIPFSHPLATCDEIGIHSLLDEKLFMHMPNSYAYRAFMAVCVKHGITPTTPQVFNRIDVIDRMVASGAGLSLMPSVILNAQLPFKIAMLKDSVEWDIILAWNSNLFLSDAMRAYISLVTKHYAHNGPPRYVDM
ncbi:MAG: HTH-type transcriptional regulator CynR [Desulfovibrio sp.]